MSTQVCPAVIYRNCQARNPFAPVLAGLGLRLLIIEDQEATERLKNRLPPRNQSFVRSVAVHAVTTRFLRKNRSQRRGEQPQVFGQTIGQTARTKGSRRALKKGTVILRLTAPLAAAR